MKLQKKNLLAQKRRWRIRKTVRGTAARPRLALKMTPRPSTTTRA
jgi:large subunit ribosomal protein L18